VNLGKYIRELILENDTVVIPGFGAIISSYRPAKIDEEGNKILPPSKEISFTSKIRNNDGLLVGYVAEKEKISHSEALQKIEKERENILYQLDKDESVTLENTGTFYSNDKHEIQFEPSLQDYQAIDSFGMEPVSLTEMPEGSGEDNYDFSALIPSEDESEQEPEFEPVEETEAWETKDEGRKKRGSWWWLLLLIIPLAGAGFYFFFYQSESTPTTFQEPPEQPVTQTNPVVEPEVAKPDTIAMDTAVRTATEKSEESVDADSMITADTPGIQYYLITGSFKEEENVDDFMSDMKKEGYQPFYLGKKGNFYLVGIETYNTEHRALMVQDSFLAENPESGAWIYIE